MPESIADQVEIWVQHDQYEEYSKYWEGVRELPWNIKTLGATREYLVKANWGQKIVLMDDDLTWYWRKDPKDWHLTAPPAWAMEQMFQEIDEALDTYAHVGISGREGQNREPSYAVENTRYMRCLCYNTALWPTHIVCSRLDGVSDFDTNLQLLRAGLPNKVFYRWAQGQRSTQSPGGMSGQRTHDSHTAEVLALCELHPGLVVPTQKFNRSGGAFGTRDEVQVAWKQALGWDARAGRIETPGERWNRELVVARARIAELEAQLAEFSRDVSRFCSEIPADFTTAREAWRR